MNRKSWIYLLARMTLIDEIAGFIYWAAVIYGIYLLAGWLNSPLLLAGVLAAYIVVAVIVYMTVVKKVKSLLKPDPDE
ncbi:hypothetical protein J5J83_19060 [Azoarcus sp. L1K30]|uniref:hypothetical protein n=1 Tax=Azoarcus sp. L1K30 TaxID=2820277 RepID=UPI001B8186E7|nr:hypothetical protein [Azoarcus sp. L1K30]MBR0568226.1 hypothetical protein [Azoarcus sp. L1K30]